MSVNKATPLTLVVSITLLFFAVITTTATANDERHAHELRELFLREYPDAVRKYEDALDHLHATGRFRHARKSNNDPKWIYIEVWKQAHFLRFNRHYAPEDLRRGKERIASNVTILRTPELSARVHEPFTSSAVLNLLSQAPHPKIDTQVNLFLMRFLKATYCLDGHSVLDAVQQGEWVLTNIALDPMHDERVKADFSIRKEKMQPPTEKNASVTISFSPRENWAIREIFLIVGEPFNFSSKVFIDDLILLKEGAYVAKKYRSTLTGAMPEKIEFELETFEETVTPVSEFTLTALGLPEPMGAKPLQPSRTWLWLLAAALAAAVLAVFFTWFKRRHAAIRAKT